jgi:beta-lactamase class A
MKFSASPLTIFAIALVVCVGIDQATDFERVATSETLDCNTQFPLLNPWLRCQPSDDLKKQDFTAFRYELDEYVENKMSQANVQVIAVYFRDLENGPWFGIEEDALFSPASMLKLPLLMAYYKQAEYDPQLLEREIAIDPGFRMDSSLAPGKAIEPGKTYTVDELLTHMIVDSDNTAFALLSSFLPNAYPDDDILGETLAALGIAKSEGGPSDFLTVKRYSSIYRALYNGSFLSKEMSQKALGLLSQTTYDRGLRAGIAEDIPIAHKFGIRFQDETAQLHDCGIVYNPVTPYLLCIMTKGESEHLLTALIQEIAEKIDAEVSRR